MIALCILSLLILNSDGFMTQFNPMHSIQNSNLFMSSMGGADNLITSLDEAFQSETNKENPLVDRALDSALDFLQDVASPVETEEEDDDLDMFEIFEDSPDIEIPYDLIEEIERKEAERLANKPPSGEELNLASKRAAISKWKSHENDSGSSAVQIAISNDRIKYLTTHLLKNRKDVAAKRGLTALVNARRKMLNFLYRNDPTKALTLASELGIRFKAPGKSWDKETKYGKFKNTKTQLKEKKGTKVRVKK